MRLRELSADAFASLYEQELCFDFPASEQKPLSDLLCLYHRGAYTCFGFFENGKLIAYAACSLAGDGLGALVDYFAVCRGGRGQGVGGNCLALLRRELSPRWPWLILEAEAVEYATDADDRQVRRSRLAFYARNGVRTLPLLVHAIGYEALVLSLDLSAAPDVEQAKNTLLSCYRQFYGETRTAAEIRFEPYLSQSQATE